MVSFSMQSILISQLNGLRQNIKNINSGLDKLTFSPCFHLTGESSSARLFFLKTIELRSVKLVPPSNHPFSPGLLLVCQLPGRTDPHYWRLEVLRLRVQEFLRIRGSYHDPLCYLPLQRFLENLFNLDVKCLMVPLLVWVLNQQVFGKVSASVCI